jgi:putative transposase
MPSKNVIKIYIKDGIYHIYNRGVEKRQIFMDEEDYRIFLYFLKRYLLSPDDVSWRSDLHKEWIPDPRWRSDLHEEIRLLCYCLMPNHFHLMIQQLQERSITEFMKRLGNAYIDYFNKKNKRVGSLFQGRYKAALVQKESHFLYLPYYIHNNPSELEDCDNPKNYSYSSYADYLGRRNTKWIFKEGLMEQFKEAETSKMDFEEVKDILGGMTLE